MARACRPQTRTASAHYAFLKEGVLTFINTLRRAYRLRPRRRLNPSCGCRPYDILAYPDLMPMTLLRSYDLLLITPPGNVDILLRNATLVTQVDVSSYLQVVYPPTVLEFLSLYTAVVKVCPHARHLSHHPERVGPSLDRLGLEYRNGRMVSPNWPGS